MSEATVVVDETTNKELIVLCAMRDEVSCKRVVAYLIEQFPMARDGQLTARASTEEDPSYLRSGWLAVIANGERFKQYTSTIERMQTAAGDFDRGYGAAMQEIEAEKAKKTSKSGLDDIYIVTWNERRTDPRAGDDYRNWQQQIRFFQGTTAKRSAERLFKSMQNGPGDGNGPIEYRQATIAKVIKTS